MAAVLNYLYNDLVARPKGWVASIDAIRVIGCIGVIAVHCLVLSAWPLNEQQIVNELPAFINTPAVKPTASAGLVAVDVFLAISGFMLGLKLLKLVRKQGRITAWSAAGIMANRTARLVPAALFVAYLGYREGNPMCPRLPELFNFGTLDHVGLDRCAAPSWSTTVDNFTWLLLLIPAVLFGMGTERRLLMLASALVALSIPARMLHVARYGIPKPVVPTLVAADLSIKDVENFAAVAGTPGIDMYGEWAAERRRNGIIVFSAYFGFSCRYAPLLMGVVAAMLVGEGSAGRAWVQHNLNWALPTTFAAAAVVYSVNSTSSTWAILAVRHLYGLVTAALLALLAVANSSQANLSPLVSPLMAVLESPLWRPLSTLSYSIYLLHMSEVVRVMLAPSSWMEPSALTLAGLYQRVAYVTLYSAGMALVGRYVVEKPVGWALQRAVRAVWA